MAWRRRGLSRTCPQLDSLSALGFRKPAPLIRLQGMTQLRKWSGSLIDLFGSPSAIGPSQPFFRTVTHVDIFDAIYTSEISSSLAALPALTHLCLHRAVGVGYLRHPLEHCPHSEVLVNLWPLSEMDKVHDIAASPPVTDVRFVVGVITIRSTSTIERLGRGGTPISSRRRIRSSRTNARAPWRSASGDPDTQTWQMIMILPTVATIVS
ncbi:hypothetical protein DFH09DRAFT_1272106 [Mycena vulgaris]|nr:hypothetical protein DFH09DRAFT_1272106 [Mycena vulgaris]